MYIRELHVENVKLLRDVSVSFVRGDEIRKWTVFVGENGLCKTTLLQAIALAASGPDRANQLADVPSFPDQRSPERTAAINADFSFGARHEFERVYPSLLASLRNVRVESEVKIEPSQQVFTGYSAYIIGAVRAVSAGMPPVSRAGAAIKYVRELAGLSVDSVSVASGVPATMIAGFEQGRLAENDVESVMNVVRILTGHILRAPGASANWISEATKLLLVNRPKTPRGSVQGLPESSLDNLGNVVTRALLNAVVGMSPLREARAQSLPWWFVAGYGTQRALSSAPVTDQSKDFVLGRLLPLFSDRRPIGTAFAEMFPRHVSREYVATLQQLLVGKDRLIPHLSGLDLPEPKDVLRLRDSAGISKFELNFGGRAVRLAGPWLSQGFQATISWIADLVGQMFLEHYQANPESTSPITPEEMEGLVLIDELDLHLHPTWQGQFVQALKNTFPNIQFIATTHSPMLLPGLEQDEVKLLKLDAEGNVVVTDAQQSPRLMTGTGIYEAFFNIDKLYPNPLGEDLRQYSYIASDPRRSDEDEARLQAIIARLGAAGVEPGFPPEPRVAR